MKSSTRWFVLAAALFAPIGCGDDGGHAPVTGGGGAPPVSTTGDPCATPATRCPCTTVGGKATCRIFRVSGAYVSCSEGTLSCGADGYWGECVGAAAVWDPSAADAATD